MIIEAISGAIGALVVNVLFNARKKAAPAEKRCASVRITGAAKNEIFCDASDRCVAVADQRCLGGNCTLHCRHGGCAGKCLE